MGVQSRASLDNALDGILSAIQNDVDQIHLTVQTHLDGTLEKGQMKLFILLVKNGETIDYAQCNLKNTAAQIIGWNIYIHDTTDSVKVHLARGKAKLKMAQGKTDTNKTKCKYNQTYLH